MPRPVVALVDPRPLGGANVPIEPAADGSGFVLRDAAGAVLASSASARALSQYAFSIGAFEVRWDFDLKLAEEPR